MSEQRRGRAGFKSALDRLDDWIRAGGERLAGNRRPSRRGFMEGVGVGAAAIAGTGLLADNDAEAQASCTLPAGCFGNDVVNVCYTPWLVTGTEPGQSNGVVVRKGPSYSAAAVCKTDGSPIVVPTGGTFGRCSNRTGSVASGCPDPGPRVSQNGFIWGYWVGYQRQGWIPTAYATGNTAWTGTLCGPAQKDFDCRKAKSACASYVGCGGGAGNTPTCSETYRPVVTVGTDISEEKYYLRYAADSTTFAWLVPGDRVKRWGYKSGATYNWSCVQVICAAYAPNGCRGWVRSDALGSPITDNDPCYPSVDCPAGSSGS